MNERRHDTEPTGEVGSEGGGHGDLEIGRPTVPTSGSEATETAQWKRDRSTEIVRDEENEGRRSP
jgi:hypothetical protein